MKDIRDTTEMLNDIKLGGGKGNKSSRRGQNRNTRADKRGNITKNSSAKFVLKILFDPIFFMKAERMRKVYVNHLP